MSVLSVSCCEFDWYQSSSLLGNTPLGNVLLCFGIELPLLPWLVA